MTLWARQEKTVKRSSRKQLRGVAAGAACHFIGRNNDLDGYWAIGKLAHLALEWDGIVELDLFSSERSSLLAPLATRCSARLRNHLHRLGFDEAVVGTAIVRVTYDSTREKPVTLGVDEANVHFECVVRLTDDRGKSYEATASGWCWPHDPRKEQQSGRP